VVEARRHGRKYRVELEKPANHTRDERWAIGQAQSLYAKGSDYSEVDRRLEELTWVVQFGAAACGSLLARGFFGTKGNLAATMPPLGQSWQAAGFEAILTFGLVLMILSLANGPKLNGPFIPLAVGAYIMAWGTMGGPFDGASMNPARSFGPDLAVGDLSTWWVYLIGPAAGAVVAVGAAYVLRGPAKAEEARAAMGTPIERTAPSA
jgi:hypothetical protein